MPLFLDPAAQNAYIAEQNRLLTQGREGVDGEDYLHSEAVSAARHSPVSLALVPRKDGCAVPRG
jgi:hypothetical protein